MAALLLVGLLPLAWSSPVAAEDPADPLITGPVADVAVDADTGRIMALVGHPSPGRALVSRLPSVPGEEDPEEEPVEDPGAEVDLQADALAYDNVRDRLFVLLRVGDRYAVQRRDPVTLAVIEEAVLEGYPTLQDPDALVIDPSTGRVLVSTPRIAADESSSPWGVEVFDGDTLAPTTDFTLDPGSRFVGGLAVGPGGAVVVYEVETGSGTVDRLLRFEDSSFAGEPLVVELEGGHPRLLPVLATADVVVVGRLDGRLHLFDAATLESRGEVEVPAGVTRLGVGAAGEALVGIDNDDRAVLSVDLGTGELLRATGRLGRPAVVTVDAVDAVRGIAYAGHDGGLAVIESTPVTAEPAVVVLDGATVQEGDPDIDESYVEVPVQLAAPVSHTVVVAVEWANGSAEHEYTDPESGETFGDFAVMTRHVVFSPGETTRPVGLSIRPDLLVEDDERFYLAAEPVVGAAGIAEAEVVLLDDDRHDFVDRLHGATVPADLDDRLSGQSTTTLDFDGLGLVSGDPVPSDAYDEAGVTIEGLELYTAAATGVPTASGAAGAMPAGSAAGEPVLDVAFSFDPPVASFATWFRSPPPWTVVVLEHVDGRRVRKAVATDGYVAYLAQGNEIRRVEFEPVVPGSPFEEGLAAFDDVVLGRTPPPEDANGDWVQDTIGGSTYGSIVDEIDGQPATTGQLNYVAASTVLRISDAPDPAGVRIVTSGPFSIVSMQLCGFQLELTGDNDLTVTCGSLLVEVATGLVKVLLGEDRVLSIPAGIEVRLAQVPGVPGAVEVTHLEVVDPDAAGGRTVTLSVGGGPEQVVEEGDTVVPPAGPVPTTLETLPLTVQRGRLFRPDTAVLRARLLATGAPVVGRIVVMKLGNRTVCQGTTDAAGVATCSVPLTGANAQLRQRPFGATFAGDPQFAASTTTPPAPPPPSRPRSIAALLRTLFGRP